MFKFLKSAFAVVSSALAACGLWFITNLKKVNVVVGDWEITVEKTAMA